MDTQHTKTENKCKVSPWKAFFKAFIVSGLLTLAAKSYETIVTSQNKMWEEYQSIYDTKDEFFKLHYICRLRIFLSENGFDNDSSIQKWLKNYGEKVYLQAKAKIPEGDIALGEFLFMYKYAPLMQFKDSIITPHDRQELLNFAKELVEKKSQMESFNKVHRFILANNITYWFLNKAPKEIRQGTGIELRIITNRIIIQMKIKDFLNLSSAFYYEPESIYFHNLKINYAFFGVNGCSDKNIQELHKAAKSLDKLINIYKNLPFINKGYHIFLEDIKAFDEVRKNIDDDLKNNCNFEIGLQYDK